MTDTTDALTDQALTVHQPWAELILRGRKTVELRTWRPPYHGRIWLHAGSRFQPDVEGHFSILNPPRGAFVGSVEVLDAASLDERRWLTWRDQHLDLGNYQPGYFGWSLIHPRRLATPIPARGQRGFFTPDAAVLAALHAAPAEADSGQSGL